MPKNDKTSKTVSAPSKPTSGGKKSSGFSKNKEKAYLERTSYKPELKDTTKSTAFKCPVCRCAFIFKSTYDFHRNKCGCPTNVTCTSLDISSPTYADIAEIRGDKFVELNNRKQPWNPSFKFQRYLNVLVDDDTGKTEKQWVTVKIYKNFKDMIASDGETIIDEHAEAVQYIDPTEINQEGDDLSIVD